MQFSFRILKRMNVSQQRLHACRGAPERVRVSVYCGTVKGPHPSHLPPSSTATVLIPEKKKTQTTRIPLAPAASEFRSAGGVTELLRV